ncbi:MAG: non-canonical purine NTP diphosphatase [Crocinitomicaceae bacterium]|nr:non-canonical purine NTP diphosphatase [Crocinitomicaceae bacterium]
MKILFATSNQNKANEIQKVLPDEIKIITLKDINLKEDIPETSPTIRGNALQKANYIKEHFNLNCFADDTGLEINALNGAPGVFSARYAGPQRSDEDNMNLVLEKLSTLEDRSARFKTVIVLQLDGETFEFEGIVEGKILEEKRGEYGFGYDPIFEPENCGKTFAEMEMYEKNDYSHRARATKKMISFLKERMQ